MIVSAQLSGRRNPSGDETVRISQDLQTRTGVKQSSLSPQFWLGNIRYDGNRCADIFASAGPMY